MKISVIVYSDPVHVNSAQALLRAFTAQTLPRETFEVVIVDHHDRPDIAGEVLELRAADPQCNIRVTSAAAPGRAAALNHGVRCTEAPLLALFADDALPMPTALESYVRFHAADPHPLSMGIGRTIFDATLRSDGLRRWLEDSGTLFGLPMRMPPPLWPETFFFAGNACLKRSALAEIGGFDERFPWITWDDFEFGLRMVDAGGRSQLVLGATAWHDHAVAFEERAASMRVAGHAAVIHERIGTRSTSWHGILQRARRNAGHAIPTDDPALPLWRRTATFQLRFDREFLAGYEAESRNDRSDLAGLAGST